MYKYAQLNLFFHKRTENSITLTIEEIENILGFKLPGRAYSSSTFWSNVASHSIALSWLMEDYFVDKIHFDRQLITFKKSTTVILNTRENPESKNLTAEAAIIHLKEYYDNLSKDTNNRAYSWDYCYKIFGEFRKKADDSSIDLLALHLGFFLASWGMYRGSSFLFSKDYKVHIPVIKEILKPKYDVLRDISMEDLIKDENLNLVINLSEHIREIYAEKNDIPIKKISDNLVSKIIFVTLGCVPAYEAPILKALREYNICMRVFNKESIYQIASYYIKNKNEFESFRLEISKGDIMYPPMRIIDMCFWKIGVSMDDFEKYK